MPKPLDTLIAYKVIAIVPGLSSADRRVAGAILDHFNHETGRCDPSIDRLADLLDLDRRTVLRAVRTLDQFGLILKDRHGGRSLRNSYEPAWEKFRELEAGWRKRFNGRSAGALVTNPTKEKCQQRHSADDKPVTQTIQRNHSIEPVRSDAAAKARNRERGGRAEGSARREKVVLPHPSSRPNFHLPASRDAAATAAQRRWSGDLLRTLSATDYVTVSVAIDDDISGKATAAEMRKHGAGLAYVLHAVRKKLGDASLGIERLGPGFEHGEPT